MLRATQLFFERYRISVAEPDYAQLARISSAFGHLPYENVTKILKDARSVRSVEKIREAEEVILDHLKWKTGGTCFSLCNAFQVILADAGFDAWIAMADMHYGANIHCAVIASVSGSRYLIDPGYLLHEPLPLPDTDLEMHRKTPMNTVILSREQQNIYSLSTIESGVKKWRYRIRAWSISADEFRQHWLHSFSLNTMDQLMLSRLSNEGRLYFRKNRIELVNSISRTKRTIESTELTELADAFGLPGDLIRIAHDSLSARSSRRVI